MEIPSPVGQSPALPRVGCRYPSSPCSVASAPRPGVGRWARPARRGTGGPGRVGDLKAIPRSMEYIYIYMSHVYIKYVYVCVCVCVYCICTCMCISWYLCVYDIINIHIYIYVIIWVYLYDDTMGIEATNMMVWWNLRNNSWHIWHVCWDLREHGMFCGLVPGRFPLKMGELRFYVRCGDAKQYRYAKIEWGLMISIDMIHTHTSYY
jgi:hypothetical protein